MVIKYHGFSVKIESKGEESFLVDLSDLIAKNHREFNLSRVDYQKNENGGREAIYTRMPKFNPRDFRGKEFNSALYGLPEGQKLTVSDISRYEENNETYLKELEERERLKETALGMFVTEKKEAVAEYLRVSLESLDDYLGIKSEEELLASLKENGLPKTAEEYGFSEEVLLSVHGINIRRLQEHFGYAKRRPVQTNLVKELNVTREFLEDLRKRRLA